MAKERFQKVRGMTDILPSEQKYWSYVISNFEKLAQLSGFKKISLPIVEPTSLFEKGTGQDTDIVRKEMYTFLDKSGQSVSLRPELTPSVVRVYLEEGMSSKIQPVKLYYIEPAFRYERPQAGRYRQFWQLGLEAIGEADPSVDAEIILISFRFLENLGLRNFTLQINSLGDQKCQPKFREELIDYYTGRIDQACPTCKERFFRNPFRLLDCKEKECQKLIERSPQIVDFLCQECKEHFQKVLDYLDTLNIPYNFNPYLVRGIDYYTKTVFEVWPSFARASEGKPEKEGGQNALGGGGRYDNLVELLGGKPTPACGVSFGMERIIQKLKEGKIKIPQKVEASVFVVQLGEGAKKKALALLDILRSAGIGAVADLSKENIKSQLRLASRLGISLTLILGQKEVIDETVIIRDMSSGVQEIVQFKNVISELKKRLPR